MDVFHNGIELGHSQGRKYCFYLKKKKCCIIKIYFYIMPFVEMKNVFIRLKINQK